MTYLTQNDQDERFMQRALRLAAETIGLASPNPQVGCVITRNGQIIAEGAHRYDQRDHAEIVALQHAGEAAAGATAYVTLEPCSHHGRTGPCADALIAARIARVVIATRDPNPLVAGQGILRLLDAGVEITVGILQQQAQDLNDAFAHFIQHHRPFVTLKAALSVDGKLAPPPHTRTAIQPHWLTGPAALHQVQLLRHASDAILTGIGTVLADNPSLTDRSGLPRRRPLLRVILDTHLRTPINSKLLLCTKSAANAAPDLLILCGKSAPTTHIAALEAWGAEVQIVPDYDGHLSLPAVLATLAERNILSLLLEAGSHLNGAFLTQHLVDKAILFYAESELGPNALPFATGIPSPFLFQQSLQRTTHQTLGPPGSQDALITGFLHNPWPRTKS
jgi:diaminohydroxyphosphoribosylaminopyrimidine deaminase/5-amino-6-(5-phosphoribosylamino)uracil reductase